MADLPRYEVGQKVWIYRDYTDQRSGEPKPGTVVKVGRKLVTVERDFGSNVYRIDTGHGNGEWNREYIKSDEKRAEDELRVRLLAELDGFGLEPRRYGRSPSTTQLQAVVTALREVES